MYLSARPKRRSLRRGLGQIIVPSMVTPLATSLPSDPANCWPYYLLGKSSYDTCVSGASAATIQQVPVNAQAYGYPANVVAVAQDAAAQQESSIPADVASADSFYSLPSNALIPSVGPLFSLGDPSTWPAWLWIAVAAIGGTILYSAVK